MNEDFDLSKVEISNPNISPKAIEPVPISAMREGFSCPKCLKRGFFPRIWAGDCPHCYGADEYGQATFCAECEFCCGC